MSCCGKSRPSFPDRVMTKVADNIKDIPHTMREIVRVGKSQPDRLQWFIDGVTGLAKCFTNQTEYPKDQIESHRKTCETCEFATKKEGRIFTHSQCMAPDPENQNKPCGCFILCKTQVGKCPLNKWTQLTINGS